MLKCVTSYRGAFALATAALVGTYLAIWHGAHVAVALPFLVILACPLMHIFMHRGHEHRSKTERTPNSDPSPKSFGKGG